MTTPLYEKEFSLLSTRTTAANRYYLIGTG